MPYPPPAEAPGKPGASRVFGDTHGSRPSRMGGGQTDEELQMTTSLKHSDLLLGGQLAELLGAVDRKSTRLNSSHIL